MGLYRDRKVDKLPVTYSYDMEYWKEPTLINCYLAGLIMTDGCVFKSNYDSYVFSYGCSIKDKCILETFIRELKCTKTYTVREVLCSLNNKYSIICDLRLEAFDKNAKYLEKHFNIKPNKTKRLGPINLTDKNLQLSVIIGCADGDGTCGIRRGFSRGKPYEIPYIHFCSASKKFVEWIKSVLDETFPHYNRKIPKVCTFEGGKCFRFCIAGERAAKIINELRKIRVPRLSRKWDNPELLKLLEEKYSHVL